MREYNDPERTRSLGAIYEMGQRRGERNNPAFQIVSGLTRMQDNIKNIRLMRQKKAEMDQGFELKKKENQLNLEKAEMLLGPDAVAGRKEEMKLHFTKQKAESAIADRQLQRAQLSSEEQFTNSVNFIRDLSKKSQESGDDLFGLQPSIDAKGNYVLSSKKGTMDMTDRNVIARQDMARKMATDPYNGFDEKKYDAALVKLGAANPTPEQPDKQAMLLKIKAARDAGYSDDEIKKYLGA